MTRMTRPELETYLKVDQKAAMTSAVANLLPSNSALTMQQIREGLVNVFAAVYDSMWEAHRQHYDILNASGILAQLNGDNPDGQFDLTLLNAGQGGLVVDGADTGYQLIPIITSGSVSGGAVVESAPFDGTIEVAQGTVLPDTLRLDHSGAVTLGGSCLAELSNNANNRQIEVDIMVFDAAGAPLNLLGFRASVNNSGNGRANTHVIPTVTIQDDTRLPAGCSIGLVIRKSALETGAVNVTMYRSFIFASYSALAPS